MAELEDFDNIDAPVDGEIVPEEVTEQPGWAKALAWATIVLGGLYIVNPTAGIFELIPDVIPVVGNLDEAAVMFLIFGAMRYLGWTLPEFIERWPQPRARLPGPRED
jgi:hypothetical protein